MVPRLGHFNRSAATAAQLRPESTTTTIVQRMWTLCKTTSFLRYSALPAYPAFRSPLNMPIADSHRITEIASASGSAPIVVLHGLAWLVMTKTGRETLPRERTSQVSLYPRAHPIGATAPILHPALVLTLVHTPVKRESKSDLRTFRVGGTTCSSITSTSRELLRHRSHYPWVGPVNPVREKLMERPS